MKYQFYIHNTLNPETFPRWNTWAVRFDGQLYRFDLESYCKFTLNYVGPWNEYHDQFIADGTWVEISADQARNLLPDGYQDHFPFPQAL